MNMHTNTTGAKPVLSRRAEIRLAHAETLCFVIAQCDPRDACEIMNAALEDLSAGQPRAPLFNYADQANWWAGLACEAELKSYMLACWSRLTSKDKAAFLDFVSEGDA